MLHNSSNREYQFILNSFRSFFSETGRDNSGIEEKLDFEKIYKLASTQQVSSILYTTLKKENFFEKTPAHFQEKLNAQYFTSALLAKFKSDELLNILKVAAASNLQVIPWRGPVFSEIFYGDINARNFGDLDFIFRKEDLPKLKSALKSIGYDYTFLGEKEKDYLAKEHALAFLKTERGVDFELDFHWSIAEKHWNISYPDKMLWQRLERHNFLGTEIPALSPEDLVLCICIHHGLRGGWQKLKHIFDLALILKKYDCLDWQSITKKAQQLKIKNALLTGCYIVEKLLGIKTPAKIKENYFYNLAISWAGKELINQLLAENKELRYQSYLTQIIGHGNFTTIFYHKLKERIFVLITPNELDKKTLDLPTGLQFLYYFIRPVRLIKKFGMKSGWNIFFKKN